MSAQQIIEVKNLTKEYGRGDGAVLAVDHISFTVAQGEFFGLLGPNGAGKTTTQRMLSTLLEPTAGSILIAGHDLGRDAYAVKRRMGLVPEESNVYGELTAWENLLFTARLYRVPIGERSTQARLLLETFGLWEQRNTKPDHFSKGMRRRLSIAMGIVHKPALLFLDEPTTGLDTQSVRLIRDLLRELNAQGMTVFLTTHQMEEADQLCNRVAIMNHGELATVDTPERLKRAFQRVQSVEVAFEPGSPSFDEGLAALPGVTRVLHLGDKWRLYTEAPAELLPSLINWVEARGLRVVSLNTPGPSLEDAFIEITGRPVRPERRETQPEGLERAPRGRVTGGRR